MVSLVCHRKNLLFYFVGFVQHSLGLSDAGSNTTVCVTQTQTSVSVHEL